MHRQAILLLVVESGTRKLKKSRGIREIYDFCNLIGSFWKTYVFVESWTKRHAESAYSQAFVTGIHDKIRGIRELGRNLPILHG